MKEIIGIATVLAITLMAVSVLANGTTTTNSANIQCSQPSDCTMTTLNLCAKDTSWQCKSGGATATLTFKTVYPTFDYELTVSGASVKTDYALIYYPDQADRFTYWNGAGGTVLGTFTTDASGAYTGTGNIAIGSLPIAGDWNANPSPNYCNNANGYDSYAHCSGAKIWIVTASDLTSGSSLPLTAWNPSNYLFETDLVTYTYTASPPTPTTCYGSQCVAVSCGLSATGDVDFGTMIQGHMSQSSSTTAVANTGNVPVTPEISGTDWKGVYGNTMPVGATAWTTTVWSNAIALTITPTSIGTVGIGGSTTVWYQLSVPFSQPTDTYSQTITFTASC